MTVGTQAEVNPEQVISLKERLATDLHALHIVSSGIMETQIQYWRGYPDPEYTPDASMVRSECSVTINEALRMPGAEWPKTGISATLLTKVLAESDPKERALGEKNNG